MSKNILYNMFIWTFVALYAITAFISFYHAIEFFSIGNVTWMSIMLAAVFEIGQATVLASLLLSDNNKVIMPWVLMVVLTTVQVIGNVYSTFKFMSLSEINYYQYLEKPLLFWVNGISQETVMIIISYIIGALLPIVALCMTTMVANNIKLKNSAQDITSNDFSSEINDTLDDNTDNDASVNDESDIKDNEITKDVEIEEAPNTEIDNDDTRKDNIDSISESDRRKKQEKLLAELKTRVNEVEFD